MGLESLTQGVRARTPAAAGMAAGTTLSRATGLIRTMVLASALGVTATSDAYNTANTAPTMIFTLVAGGALSAAVVPMLARAGDRRLEVASVLLGTTMVVGVAASLLVALAAPALFALLAAGARGRGDYVAYAALGGSWLRMFAPQVGLYAISVLAVAIMTARRRLVLGATAPVATNLITIAIALAYISIRTAYPSSPVAVSHAGRLLLGWGTTAAVATMAAIQLWGARRCEPGLSVRVDLRHPAVRELRGLGGWMLVYVVANQVGLAAVIAIASTVAGGVTAYQWGFMVMQLPYAIIAVSLLSAALPSIAERSEPAARADAVTPPARLTLVWLAPASVAMVLAASPLAVVVVGGAGSVLVAAAITGFAVSLVPFSMFQLLTRTSYAMGDTRLPALVNLGVNLANVLAAFVAVAAVSTSAQTVLGLALSHAFSYVVGCVLLGRLLAGNGTIRPGDILRPVPRIVLASAPVAIALITATRWLPPTDDRQTALVLLGAGGLGGAAVYVSLVRTMRIDQAPRPQ